MPILNITRNTNKGTLYAKCRILSVKVARTYSDYFTIIYAVKPVKISTFYIGYMPKLTIVRKMYLTHDKPSWTWQFCSSLFLSGSPSMKTVSLIKFPHLCETSSGIHGSFYVKPSSVALWAHELWVCVSRKKYRFFWEGGGLPAIYEVSLCR